jgi:hypothetical protein
MDQNLENRIRERAYGIWAAHGCMHGQAEQHWLVDSCARNADVALLGFRLFVASRLLRGLKLLHGLLQAGHDAFERDDLGGGLVQLLSEVERILCHEPLQKIDVALKAPRSLVQTGGFRAVLYSGDILRTPGLDSDDDQAQAQHRDSDHALLSIPIFAPS